MLQISPLADRLHQAAVTFLRGAPYRNALPLANVTQLRASCDVVVAHDDGMILGVASSYRDLPVPNVTYAASRMDVVAPLLAGLLELAPQLRNTPAWALMPEERVQLLAQHAQLIDAEIEYQMAAEPETLQMPQLPAARRLRPADLPAVRELARASGLTVWRDAALQLGPAFGCEIDGQLVAMAATQFATTDVIEIGHVATHPDFRRRGYASACTVALTQAAFALAPRVYLMVLDRNRPALQLYRQLGFQIVERFCLARFILS
ncbi:MAG TPA: GNAT family N-acetyltransferase [Roseiflexaceae bacterium]|nr:GNAT family N-acetyltransferase [Roseiflexaceae bacterium]HMP43273.1 GNAT family N-acetyltransferase [Roseiflexaceae bacterium]